MNKERILTLIRDKQILLSNERIEPHDFISLKSLVIQKEMAHELEALEHLAAGDGDFESAFKERCKTRARQNEGSCLSFTEMPEGVVNQLYWDIARLITPEPQTMGAMLMILLPDLNEKIVPDYILQKDLQSGRVLLQNVKFKSQSLNILDEEPTLKRLGEFVIAGSKLFDVSDIALLKFNYHRSFHEAIRAEHPDIAELLYKHNPSLRTLADRLSLLQGQGQTPFEAITVFSRELRLSSTYITGMTYAARNAGIALASFMGYLEALPVDVKDRLLAISPNEKSVASIINDLKMGSCTEVASRKLQSILDHHASHDFLNNRPLLPDNYISNIVKEYAKDGLATKAIDSSISLPQRYLEEVLPQIQINNAHDLINFLISFPPELYSSLLEKSSLLQKRNIIRILELPEWASHGVQVLPKLASQIRGGILNEAQKKAFFAALLTQYERFPSCISFYIMCGETVENLMPLLAEIPKKTLLLIMQERHSIYYKPLLKIAASKPEFLRELLLLLPEADRLLAVKRHINNYDNSGCSGSPIHWAAINPESLRIILSLYPQDEQLQAVKIAEVDGITVLHEAAINYDSLQLILNLYPEDEKLTAVKEKNRLGEGILYKAVQNLQSLRFVLALYPKSERLPAIKERNLDGKTPLHSAAAFPESLSILLALYPADQRLKALKEKDNNGLTVFQHRAAAHPSSDLILLQSLPLKDRPAARKAMISVREAMLSARRQAQINERWGDQLLFRSIIKWGMAFPLALWGSAAVSASAFGFTLSALILLPTDLLIGSALLMASGLLFFSLAGSLLLGIENRDNQRFDFFIHSKGLNILVGLSIAALSGVAAGIAVGSLIFNPALFSTILYNMLAYGASIAGAGLATYGLFSSPTRVEPENDNVLPALQDNIEALPAPAI